ncbi:Predicted oxidoreductase [Actinokineospora alba]|uniref:Predicted oxidoreductase n=2 Tax=Actinokineospora alba TaxID=504798 RepID=A0A1H0W3A0_9PSEU|nr:aryl-alcohol dehydrogenase-like predicted oxidoreductase [Actinokineospora alba]SDI72307.1 Predicted oxidoreductase [Actinokineospora alba]SDP85018.1 Predicted oxidoreductase [Actinokineospora alba]
MMGYRLLGRTGLRVSDLFLGAMRFTSTEQARPVFDRYAEAGGNVIDTAVTYGGGQSERVVGDLLAGRRDRFVLSTKYTMTRDATDVNAAGNHRKNLALSLETSLRQLRTDYLDLYWIHMWDQNTPIEETMRALDDAVRSGKVLYVGVSDAPAWVVARANTLAQWRGWSPFAGLQVPYNLLNRDIERELLPMAESLGLSVAAWAPLAHGGLSGKGEGPVVEALREVAAELGATAAQVAIAWTMAHSPVVHPLLGASRVEQLEDNLGALEVTLPDEAVARLEAAADFSLGFPGDFIAKVGGAVFGDHHDRVRSRRTVP